MPEDKKATLIPAGWFESWADATFATDPVGAKMTPPALRAPNGVQQDGDEFFSAGKPYYDPGKITVPTLHLPMSKTTISRPPLYIITSSRDGWSLRCLPI